LNLKTNLVYGIKVLNRDQTGVLDVVCMQMDCGQMENEKVLERVGDTEARILCIFDLFTYYWLCINNHAQHTKVGMLM